MGDFDIGQALQPYGMLLAGALFGGGWWAWVDAFVYSAAILHVPVNPLFHLPGVVATLAVILMALTRRSFDGYEFAGEEEAECRSKFSLFIAYLAAFGSIAGSVAILVVSKQQSGDVHVGVANVLQTAIICLSGLILWLTKGEDSDTGYSLLS